MRPRLCARLLWATHLERDDEEVGDRVIHELGPDRVVVALHDDDVLVPAVRLAELLAVAWRDEVVVPPRHKQRRDVAPAGPPNQAFGKTTSGSRIRGARGSGASDRSYYVPVDSAILQYERAIRRI